MGPPLGTRLAGPCLSKAVGTVLEQRVCASGKVAHLLSTRQGRLLAVRGLRFPWCWRTVTALRPLGPRGTKGSGARTVDCSAVCGRSTGEHELIPTRDETRSSPTETSVPCLQWWRAAQWLPHSGLVCGQGSDPAARPWGPDSEWAVTQVPERQAESLVDYGPVRDVSPGRRRTPGILVPSYMPPGDPTGLSSR